MTHESQAPEGGQAAEIQPLPQAEFDALMDHIYEYGTMAEGITARARAMCQAYARAALAAQPQAPVALTDEQIARLWSEAYDDATGRRQSLVFARAIEAAHGITQTKEPTNDR